MSTRLKGLSQSDHDATVVELNDIAVRMTKIANVIGPAYGAKWCDMALKLYREALTLRGKVEDEYYRHPTPPPSHEDGARARQRDLAKLIGEKFHDGARLIPLDRHSSFGGSPAVWDCWHDRRIHELAWWAVGQKLAQAADPSRVIDHAWLAGYAEPPHEPWVLITEPYIAAEKAEAVVRAANRAMADWDVRVHLLPEAMSAWNPGGCRPIIATFTPESGGVDQFMGKTLRWAITQLHS